MHRHLKSAGWTMWVLLGTSVWLAVLAVAQGRPMAATETFGEARLAPEAISLAPPATPVAQAAQQLPPGYIGEDGCLTCHEQQAKGYVGSPHHRIADPRTPAAKQGCETCHGPGAKHAEDPAGQPVRIFRLVPPDEVNATCASCHSRGEHALWDGSQHESRGLSCITCHSVHTPMSPAAQLKKEDQAAVCASCHRDKVAKLDRSGHMPVREGKMACSTCHNPHGSTNERLLRRGDSIAEACTSCHADKRGPFLWEHAPSRDGCVTCHDPHGSMNERMLVAKPPILCQRCHVATRHPSTIYDQAAIASSQGVRVFARSCVTCHSAIHGSNHPSGQRFIR